MNRNRRILFLLLINLALAFLSLYVLDMLQVVDYKQILGKVPFFRQNYAVKIEDPYLLQRLELQKKEQLLDERIRNYQQDRKKLEEDLRNLAVDKENVMKEKDNVRNMIDSFEKAKAEKETYDLRVNTVAAQLEDMFPQDAVNILSKQDDMLIIDILKKMDARAAAAGTQSLVPYLVSLMDPEQSARVQRKMLQ